MLTPGQPEPSTLKLFDFCIAWNWPFDTGFICLLEQTSREKNFRLMQVTLENLDSANQMLQTGEYGVRGFLDRASDSDPKFKPLSDWACRNTRHFFNPTRAASRASDKAAIHYALINAGLQTPHTIILPPFDSNPALPKLDLSPLGEEFTIKPAHGGGSEGVVMQARHTNQIQTARQHFPTDAYLLQATIHPIVLDGNFAWFRILFCCGLIFPCWWNTQTHVYAPVSGIHSDRFHLSALRSITRTIADLINLDLFSTEVALTSQEQFVVVDYINDPIDLRPQSEAVDGVPDDILYQIALRLLMQSASA